MREREQHTRLEWARDAADEDRLARVERFRRVEDRVRIRDIPRPDLHLFRDFKLRLRLALQAIVLKKAAA